MEWKYTDENPLRVVTLCSGYDSQLMALRNIGIPCVCVGWSEIDKYAIRAHDAVFPEIADRNLEWMLEGHSITPLEALRLFNSMRLGARIAEIKAKGYLVYSEFVTGPNGKKFKKYYL